MKSLNEILALANKIKNWKNKSTATKIELSTGSIYYKYNADEDNIEYDYWDQRVTYQDRISANTISLNEKLRRYINYICKPNINYAPEFYRELSIISDKIATQLYNIETAEELDDIIKKETTLFIEKYKYKYKFRNYYAA